MNHHGQLKDWLNTAILERKKAAQEHQIPLGNTEGWGPVIWMDHPNLDWSFVKEAGLAGARLGVENDYSFNCSSNFTHPHFSLWEDIEWHKEITGIIRKGQG